MRCGSAVGGGGGGGVGVATNSAEAVHSRLRPLLARGEGSDNDDDRGDRGRSGVFLFPVNNERLRRILPSPLDEVAGVFHMKAYIVDDEMVLSGANLSEEYFDDRLDRYMLFTNGGGGLVDFYAGLCDALCGYAIRYDGRRGPGGGTPNPPPRDEGARKRELELSLARMFDGSGMGRSRHRCDTEDGDGVVAWAVPTIQIPSAFAGGPVGVPSDAEVTRNLLTSALGDGRISASVRLSSAYLNLTRELTLILTMYGRMGRGNVGS